MTQVSKYNQSGRVNDELRWRDVSAVQHRHAPRLLPRPRPRPRPRLHAHHVTNNLPLRSSNTSSSLPQPRPARTLDTQKRVDRKGKIKTVYDIHDSGFLEFALVLSAVDQRITKQFGVWIYVCGR